MSFQTSIKATFDFLIDKIKTIKGVTLLKVDSASKVNTNNSAVYTFFDLVLPNNLPDGTEITFRCNYIITNTFTSAQGMQFLIEFDGLDELDSTTTPFTIANNASTNFGWLELKLTYLNATTILLAMDVMARRGQVNGGNTGTGSWNGHKIITKAGIKTGNKVLRLKHKWTNANALTRFENILTKAEQR